VVAVIFTLPHISSDRSDRYGGTDTSRRQYSMAPPWLLNFGIAYDSEFQDSSNVSPLVPANTAWRFGMGTEHQASKTFKWGLAAEYLYGGTLDTNLQSTLPEGAATWSVPTRTSGPCSSAYMETGSSDRAELYDAGRRCPGADASHRLKMREYVLRK
jgi:hypothetical protein